MPTVLPAWVHLTLNAASETEGAERSLVLQNDDVEPVTAVLLPPRLDGLKVSTLKYTDAQPGQSIDVDIPAKSCVKVHTHRLSSSRLLLNAS